MTSGVPAPQPAVDAPIAADDRVLADREPLACIAVERTRMPMLVIDPHGPGRPVMLANQAMLALTGYEAPEILGRGYALFHGPATDPAAADAIEAALATGGEVTTELVGHRKDGTTFCAQAFFSPVSGEGDELLYYFCSYLDVGARRQAEALEAAEHRLLLEVDHRAKNALALVDAIVRLSRVDDPDRYARAVQGRVGALARAHALLADRSWRDIPLGRVVETEAQSLGAGGAARIELRPAATPTRLSATQVQPLALVLHEMLSNAARHGALSAPGGRLSLAWRAEGGDILIEHRETGGPAPAPARRPGFGMTMIDATVRRQLGGHTRFDWRPEGLAIELRVPAPRGAAAPGFRLSRSPRPG